MEPSAQSAVPWRERETVLRGPMLRFKMILCGEIINVRLAPKNIEHFQCQPFQGLVYCLSQDIPIIILHAGSLEPHTRL